MINGKFVIVVGSVGIYGNLVVGGVGMVLIGNSGGGVFVFVFVLLKLCL